MAATPLASAFMALRTDAARNRLIALDATAIFLPRRRMLTDLNLSPKSC